MPSLLLYAFDLLSSANCRISCLSPHFEGTRQVSSKNLPRSQNGSEYIVDENFCIREDRCLRQGYMMIAFIVLLFKTKGLTLSVSTVGECCQSFTVAWSEELLLHGLNQFLLFVHSTLTFCDCVALRFML